MFASSKNKWLVSLVLAGILLALSLLGGKWGTTYAADNSVNANPVINFIVPDHVPAGVIANVPMYINGANFGIVSDTAVRIQGNGIDKVFNQEISYIDAHDIYLTIGYAYFLNPTIYNITVVMSTAHTMPTIPITGWDLESNAVPLIVFTPLSQFIPLVNK
jgi:hypothetical protein